MADDNYWQVVLITVPIVGAVIATLFFLLRLYSRLLTSVKLNIGDLLMFFGLFFSYGATISTILAAVREGKTNIWGLGSEHREEAALLFWITQTFWPLSQAFIKFSTIILLHNLLGSSQKLHITTTSLLIFTAGWGLASLLVNIFQCWPPQYFWLQDSARGNCIASQTAFYISIGSLSLVEDILILLLPVAVIWRLKLAVSNKIQLTGLFSIGSLVCVFSLLRLIEFNNYLKHDSNSSASKEALWTLLELDLAIVCSSLILMRPLFRKCKGAYDNSCCSRRGKTISPC